MLNISAAPETGAAPSPLWICDRLISMAQAADRAGYAEAAAALVRLAVDLPEGRPTPVLPRRRSRSS